MLNGLNSLLELLELLSFEERFLSFDLDDLLLEDVLTFLEDDLGFEVGISYSQSVFKLCFYF